MLLDRKSSDNTTQNIKCTYHLFKTYYICPIYDIQIELYVISRTQSNIKLLIKCYLMLHYCSYLKLTNLIENQTLTG